VSDIAELAAAAREHDRRQGTQHPTPAPAGQVVWLLAVPAAVLTFVLILVLAPPLGRFLFPIQTADFWPSALAAVKPKPTEEARYLLALVGAIMVPLSLLWLSHRGWLDRVRVPRWSAAVVQVAFVVALGFAVFIQKRVAITALGTGYFTSPTVIVSCLLAAALITILHVPRLRDRADATLHWRPRVARGPAAVIATLMVVIWLLPAIQFDHTVASSPVPTWFDLVFTYDEGMSVLNGHTPLVNFVTQYGALWPYVAALPMHFFNGSLGSYTISMTVISAFCMLAVYAVLRRVTRTDIGALVLFLPFVATSAYIMVGTPVVRYSFVDYFGAFPLRYAGPYFTAWLLARHLSGERPRHVFWIFVVAGLSILNNGDFGVPSLGAVIVALALTARWPVPRRVCLRRLGEGLAGLVVAYGLVGIVTVARTGDLPHLSYVFEVAHVFVLAGYQMLPMQWYGFWVAIYLTFCCALIVATMMAIRRTEDRVTAGLLGWAAIFGLGAGSYYAGRSHPQVLVASFSIWSLTIALLLVATVRAVKAGQLRLGLPQLALCVGFGLTACSMAQFPAPWQSITRLQTRAPTELFDPAAAVAFIKAHVTPGTPVALLTDEGQRMSRDAHVDDVSPFTGLPSMPTKHQFNQTLSALRAAGGDEIVVHENGELWPEIIPAMERRGFRQVAANGPASSTDRYVLFVRKPS
jgi:hypothetical protein